MIIGISGHARSGKDTFAKILAKILQKQTGLAYVLMAYANELKNKIQNDFDLSYDQLWGDEKEVYDLRYPKKRGQLPYCAGNRDDGKGLEVLEERQHWTAREIMQDYGQFFRTIDYNFWVDYLFRIIKEKDYKNVIITDKCGLHVGMSINGTVNDLNLSNFLTSLDPRFIVSLWPDRIRHNQYVKDFGTQIKKLEYFENIDTTNLASHLLSVPHTFITLKNFAGKFYLELRVPGGTDYHHKFKELFILIDYIADKMLLNNSKTPKPISKKCTKKMLSYINRIAKHSYNSIIGGMPIKVLIDKINSGIKINPRVFVNTLDQIIGNISYSKVTREKIMSNKTHLYSIIKYCIVNEKIYNDTFAKSHIDMFLKIVKDLDLHIKIPPKESIPDKIKLFKRWQCLPTPMLINLFSSFDNKHAYKYLVKYVSDGILHTILEDSKGVLKKHKLTHIKLSVKQTTWINAVGITNKRLKTCGKGMNIRNG